MGCLPVILLIQAQLVWGNVVVATETQNWLTEILLLVGVLSLLTSFLLLIWFHLIPRVRSHGVEIESQERHREEVSAGWLILLFLLISALAIPASVMNLSPDYMEVTFDSEYLVMEVLPNLTEYRMTGHYLIRNPGDGPAPVTLLVPFPKPAWRDTTIHLNGTHRTRVLRTEQGYKFRYRFHPRETLKIAVCGLRRIQSLENGTRLLRYDVTTTRSWRESIREAFFEITLPVESQVLEVYPRNWTAEITPEGLRIRILERSFMPDRQLTVRFHPSTLPANP